MTEPDSIWSQEDQGELSKNVQFTDLVPNIQPVEPKKRRKQVTSDDIDNDPENRANNPTILAPDYPLFNQGYKPGRTERLRVPREGRIRFLTKPQYDPQEGVHNWYVEAIDSEGNPMGGGYISTWNRRGSIITTDKKTRITVFRSANMVR